MDDFTSWWLSWWVRTIAYTFLAAFGGFLGYIMRSLDEKQPVKFHRALIEGFAAGFVGLLIMLMCSTMNFSDYWTGIIVGVSGWLGANASIRLLEKVVYRKLGLTKGELPTESSPPEGE